MDKFPSYMDLEYVFLRNYNLPSIYLFRLNLRLQ